MSKYCIGVDLGGTNIAVGLIDLDLKAIVKSLSVKTNAPRSCESISDDIAEICRRLCGRVPAFYFLPCRSQSFRSP